MVVGERAEVVGCGCIRGLGRCEHDEGAGGRGCRGRSCGHGVVAADEGRVVLRTARWEVDMRDGRGDWHATPEVGAEAGGSEGHCY
jgi:hypothetical protein